MSCFSRCASRFIAAVIWVGVTVGCSAVPASAPEGEAEVVIVDFADRQIAFRHPPQRIVALGNGEVDIIYALGGEVVGRPLSDFALPDGAAEDAAVVGSVHTVDLERIAVLQPDVVLGNDPLNVDDIPMLERIGTQVVLTHANSIDDILRQVELFGELLHKQAKADELIAKLSHGLEEALSGVERGTGPRVLLVYGAPGTYLAALPNSLAGNLLETAGGRNVAADFPSLHNFPQYAQLNTERVVEASPDVILIMTHGSTEEVELGFIREMESNPAWESISAVANNRIHVLPAELFGTNPGTRVVEAVRWLEEIFG